MGAASGVVILIKAVEHGRFESELVNEGTLIHSQTTVYDSVVRSCEKKIRTGSQRDDLQMIKETASPDISPEVWDAEIGSYIRIRSEREYCSGRVVMERTGIRQIPMAIATIVLRLKSATFTILEDRSLKRFSSMELSRDDL